MSWIDVQPIVDYHNGATDIETVRAMEDIIKKIVHMVIQKHAGKISQEVVEDIEGETKVTIFKNIMRDYVDFEKHSAFNYVYTAARNSLTNVVRKNGREITLSDLSESAEEYLIATATEWPSLDNPETGALIDNMRKRYAKLKARTELLGAEMESFGDRLSIGCESGDDSIGSSALLLVAMRTLVRRDVAW